MVRACEGYVPAGLGDHPRRVGRGLRGAAERRATGI